MSDVQIFPWPIEPVAGGKVALGDVIGRDAFILRLLEHLKAGNNDR